MLFFLIQLYIVYLITGRLALYWFSQRPILKVKDIYLLSSSFIWCNSDFVTKFCFLMNRHWVSNINIVFSTFYCPLLLQILCYYMIWVQGIFSFVYQLKQHLNFWMFSNSSSVVGEWKQKNCMRGVGTLSKNGASLLQCFWKNYPIFDETQHWYDLGVRGVCFDALTWFSQSQTRE